MRSSSEGGGGVRVSRSCPPAFHVPCLLSPPDVKTGSWMGSPQGKRAPRVDPIILGPPQGERARRVDSMILIGPTP